MWNQLLHVLGGHDVNISYQRGPSIAAPDWWGFVGVANGGRDFKRCYPVDLFPPTTEDKVTLGLHVGIQKDMDLSIPVWRSIDDFGLDDSF